MVQHMPEVIVGPMLRFIGESEATVWVETDEPCEVEILGCEVEPPSRSRATITRSSPSTGLEAGQVPSTTRSTSTASAPGRRRATSSRIRAIRPIPADGDLRLLFGSCRTSAPHRPPHTFQRWWHPEGPRDRCAAHVRAADAAPAEGDLARRDDDARRPALRRPAAEERPRGRRAREGPRRRPRRGRSRTSRSTRSATATSGPIRSSAGCSRRCPTSMIFDDHEINDKWKTSQAWLDEKRQTDWYEGRVIGGLMAYWIYQHLGNLSPAELDEDEAFGKLPRRRATAARWSATSPSGPSARRGIRGSASAATSARPGWSSSTRGPAVSSRRASAGSSSDGGVGVGQGQGRRRAQPPADRRARCRSCCPTGCTTSRPGRRRSATAPGASGSSRSGRRCGTPPTSITGPASSVLPRVRAARHRHRLRQLRRAAGVDRDVRRRRPPLLRLRGRACRPTSGTVHSKVWHAVCSGLRKELQLNERLVLGFGHTWIAAKLGRLLAASAERAAAAPELAR